MKSLDIELRSNEYITFDQFKKIDEFTNLYDNS